MRSQVVKTRSFNHWMFLITQSLLTALAYSLISLGVVLSYNDGRQMVTAKAKQHQSMQVLDWCIQIADNGGCRKLRAGTKHPYIAIGATGSTLGSTAVQVRGHTSV